LSLECLPDGEGRGGAHEITRLIRREPLQRTR
jgi:hypothetical protein